MKLIINKIGKIKHAQINIEGLTVIAGKNDTGKSTIGKVLYAVLKALGVYVTFFEKNKLSNIQQNLLLPLLQKVNASSVVSASLSQEIGAAIDLLRAPIFLHDKEELTEQKILDLLKNIRECFAKQLPIEIGEEIDKITTNLNKIRTTSNAEKALLAFDFYLKSIFSGVINNSKYHELGEISVFNQENNILNFQVHSENISKFNIDTVKAKSLYGKPIYIESPFVLEKILAFDKPNWQEITSFFRGDSKPLDRISINTEMLDFIQTTIFQKAKFSFDPENNDFCYQVDNDATKLTLLDVASGIKSFALIFSLLQRDFLTKDSLLILDEPENHLHPEWQIKYAEMVCLMVSKGFPIILTSHSPTFIQALKSYSRKYDIQNKTSFYLAEQVEKENYSVFTDVSDDISQISKNLIEPMDQLFLGI